jgi:hypothetical protein
MKFGQISKIYIMSPDGTPMTLFGDAGFAAEFLARIAATGGTADTVRAMEVLGTYAAPTREEVLVSGLQRIMTPGQHTIAFSIDDLSDENKALLRQSQCNLEVMAWFETPDLFFGGNTGVLCTMIIDWEIAEGDTSIVKGIGTLKWRAKQSPEVIDNPFV